MHDKVQQLMDEGLISMAEAALLYGGVNKATPLRHALKGYTLPDGSVVRLEAIRVGGQLKTTKAAVMRFFEAQNVGTGASLAPISMPTVSRAAAQAHAKLKVILSN